jgi:uncharacterized Ntn-hydrolase superfamily protein
VAARCAHARAGVGAVATQNVTDPALGAALLGHLAAGEAATTALSAVLSATRHGAYRQLLAIGARGAAVTHTGAQALGVHATAVGEHCAAGGNLLASAAVPEAMAATFGAARGHFAARLLVALRAGLDAGGEAGPVRSAGVLVVREVSWPVVDLRVDWHDDPVTELERVYAVYAPQVDDYVRRALRPADAPRFGVPGDP